MPRRRGLRFIVQFTPQKHEPPDSRDLSIAPNTYAGCTYTILFPDYIFLRSIMALVGYSDSEGSDNESPAPAPAPKTAPSGSKPAFQKVVDRSQPGKIKVELPTLAKGNAEEQARPAKKPRMGGGFSGFNSFLPAPKRTAEASGVKKGLGSGVNLKTSANAAFSREPVEQVVPEAAPAEDEHNEEAATETPATEEPKMPEEVKITGNAMRFKPLSVANRKKPGKKNIIPGAVPTESGGASRATTGATTTASASQAAPAPPPPEPKISLFSVPQEDDEPVPAANISTGQYQPFMTETAESSTTTAAEPSYTTSQPQNANPNSLDAIASDLNLTPAQRRQLFGRNKDAAALGAINITNFNTDAEYIRNEKLRAEGQAVEHRAVKSIAPGKHSLQQLVNAANTQKEALEDAWAEGKRNKAEGGSKYGW